MMSVFSRAGAGIQNILSEWRQPASRSSLCVGSFLFGRESGHSIARPIACGNRVPPQRTLALGNSLPCCLQSWHKAKKPETH